jgi:predicted ATP-grasp superfamily ATP-dependent carboligase
MMLQAVVNDLCLIPGLSVVTTRDIRMAPVRGNIQNLICSPDDDVRSLWRQAIESSDAVLPIAPETGGKLEWISQCVVEHGKILLGSRPEGIMIASSKLKTSQCLAENGVPVVSTARLEDGIHDSGTGWVIKPDDGAGCEDAFFFHDRNKLESWFRRIGGSGWVVQPWLAGTAASLSLLCSDQETWLVACNEQLIERDGMHLRHRGNVVNSIRDNFDELERVACEVTRSIPGLWGYVGIDLVIGLHGPVVIEVNPRLTTSYIGLKDSTGLNPAEAIVRIARDGYCLRDAVSNCSPVTVPN